MSSSSQVPSATYLRLRRFMGPTLSEVALPPTAPQPRVRAGHKICGGSDPSQSTGCVYYDPGSGNSCRKVIYHFLILSMDGEGMACSFVMQDLLAETAYLHIIRRCIEGQDRRQLLIRIRMSSSHSGLSGHQYFRSPQVW